MKISRSWLNHVTSWPIMTSDHAASWHGRQFDESDEVIAATLTKLGFEVEAIEQPENDASANAESAPLTQFTVGEIISAEQHPEADRLRVCRVATKEGTLQVVCGAPNARAGIKIAFAPVGSVIPSTGDKLKKSKIRGVESMGMCCSARELNLGDDHNGIIELPSHAKIGDLVINYVAAQNAPAPAAAKDSIFDVAITPNRADGLGVQGIRRELVAAGLGKSVAHDSFKPAPPQMGKRSIAITIAADALPFCPHFASQLVENVENKQSPEWLVALLNSVGQKSISALVDVTNYLMIEANRPLHVFDADKIKGDLTIRLSHPGENFTALNGKNYELPAGSVVIADESGILSLGGIMGGESSGVSMTTKNVLIEAAWFDPARIAATGRALGLHSDARHRFERGVDTDSASPAIKAACAMVVDLCGGVIGGQTEAGAPPKLRQFLSFRPARVAQLGGVDVPQARQKEILHNLGFAVSDEAQKSENDAVWQIMPPSWRLDCEGEADLVEEILRHHGFDAMAATPLPRLTQNAAHRLGGSVLSIAEINRVKARRLLAARGLHEAVTWAFMDKETARLFGGGQDNLTLSNPIAADLSQMRPTPLPNLLAAAARQVAHGESEINLFEIGPGFRAPEPKGQHILAAGIRLGRRQEAWRQQAPALRKITHSDGHYDVFDVKQDVLAVLELLGFAANNLQFVTQDMTRHAPWYHPGQAALVTLGGKITLAQFGMIHPTLRAKYDLDVPLAAFEIFLDAIPPAKNKGKSSAKPLLSVSLMQKFDRDLAFVVDENLEASLLLRIAQKADSSLIEKADIFDVYYGEKLPPGKKSVALRVTIAPPERALRDDEIAALEQKIITAITTEAGGTLRG